MCGIVGFLGSGEYQDIVEMAKTLRLRGPDEMNFYQDPSRPVYLGHTRLMIRDKEGGHQPMKSREEDIVVIYNGQIYNERELRKELESLGHVFQSSHSDTEILIHGYKAWGEKLVEHLNGMWAFAILDRTKGKIFLSRDRFGKKPLYYSIQRGIFAFASELKALKKHRSLTLNVSVRGVQKYHAHGYFPANWSIYEEVKKLPGGHNLVFDIKNHDCKITRYWSYKIEPDYAKDEKYWVERVDNLLRSAVHRRLVSDVPLGVFLSGGLDSSIVSALAGEKLKGKNLHSFSIGFLDPTFDETKSALLVSGLLGTQHFAETFDPQKLPLLQEQMFSLLDEPFSDSSMMSYYLLCRHARKKITVALGGDAGDELFAGYDTFRALKIISWVKRLLPKPCHDGILSVLSRLPISHSYMTFRFRLERLLKGYASPASLWNPLWLGPIPKSEIEILTNAPVKLEDLYSEAIEFWDKSSQKNLVDKALEFYGNLFLQDQILVKVDRLSMMHSLEVRAPFLDVDLVDCVRTIPSTFKLKGEHSKYILKKMAERYLPKNIVWRKKVGFSAPLSRWFSDNSLEFKAAPYWNDNARNLIQEKFTNHKALKDDCRLFLWNSYVLNEFAQRQQLRAAQSTSKL
ncbi:MAG: asparagine synthase (glutamine-hydrolyzing) [Candidatus Omnitrophica bacterium]|nr:asparagine synthase (glutamine-hydrolyzing) [Candidatus Omnitrophota bacterium]